MNRIAPLALCGLAALLTATVVAEFRAPQTVPASRAAPAAPQVPAAAAPRAAMGADAAQIQSWVSTILARPLFTRDRRPPGAPVTVTAAAAPQSLPRLTGIAISPAGRHAIFASAGGKPLVTSPGDHVAGFTVQAIDPGGVTVVGPGGRRLLQPSFQAAPRAAGGGVATSSPTASGIALALPPELSPERLQPGRTRFPEAEFNRVAQQPAGDAP